jgi:hypothetical protein
MSPKTDEEGTGISPEEEAAFVVESRKTVCDYRHRHGIEHGAVPDAPSGSQHRAARDVARVGPPAA